MLKLTKVNKFYNKGRQNQLHVLNDVSLELPDKGMVAIFGRSGCGKTTLLNVVGGLDNFADGQVTIEGTSIRKNTDKIRNQYIGYIFQNYNLNNDISCYDNIADALRLCGIKDENIIKERVNAALTNVGMEKYGKRPPNTLSGGQQQRIAIARAIVKNPRIILADEPTGNLDEANTIMIMNLLKAISKERLVLLVTHEANLVNYFCDTVIELSDGQVINTRQNKDAGGYVSRSKNDIWLGELSKQCISNENVDVEFYGDLPETPVKIKIVNNSGKLYLSLDNEKIQILDDSSETKLREGVYEETAIETAENIDMSALPPIEGEHFGRLFDLKASIFSGYKSNFKNSRKKGKRFLQICMILFAVVLVLMSSVFGTAVSSVIDISDSANHNTFYVYTPDYEISKKLLAAMNDKDSGIDYVRMSEEYYNPSNIELSFSAGNFETFSAGASILSLPAEMKAKAVFLEEYLAKEMKCLAGKKDGLKSGELIITKKVADMLLEDSPYGYITDYEDLLGLTCSYLEISYSVVGVVNSSETAVYACALDLANIVMSTRYGLRLSNAASFGLNVAQGQAVLYLTDTSGDTSYPSVDGQVQILGDSVTVSEVIRAYSSYDDFVASIGGSYMGEKEWFTLKVKETYPELEEGSAEFNAKYAELKDARMYEYLLDEVLKYVEAEAAYYDQYEIQTNIYAYLLTNVKLKEAKAFIYAFENYGSEELYYAMTYKNANGSYPSVSAVKMLSDITEIADSIKNEWEMQYYSQYESHFWNAERKYPAENSYIVSQEDYIKFSKQTGKSDNSAYSFKSDMGQYTLVHSSDYNKSQAWLKENIVGFEVPDGYDKILTPINVMLYDITLKALLIVSNLVSMAVVFVLMSICVYFIMRSSLMNRIKEVGIYRAIGVSKKNLIFKFFVEALVLNSLTVFIGFLIISVVISVAIGASATIGSLLFYPVWYAALILLLMSAVTLFFGVLPIMMLLRKTPSAILSKYDI